MGHADKIAIQAGNRATGQSPVRGQVAIEFLAVVAFFLLISVPLFMYFYSAAPQKEYYASLSQAEVAADEFAKYGELVGSQGNGTSISRIIVLPKNTGAIRVHGTHVSIRVASMGLETDVVRTGPVNFSDAEFTVGSGSYMFTFTNMGGNVNVTMQ